MPGPSTAQSGSGEGTFSLYLHWVAGWGTCVDPFNSNANPTHEVPLGYP